MAALAAVHSIVVIAVVAVAIVAIAAVVTLLAVALLAVALLAVAIIALAVGVAVIAVAAVAARRRGIIHLLLEPGEYLLVVSGEASRLDPYYLRVDQAGAPLAGHEIEPNGTPAMATPMIAPRLKPV